MIASPFPAVEKCSSKDRGGDTIVADLDGTLLCGRSSFPYFAHMAFETGGVLRLLALILLAPLAGVLYYLVSESAGIQVLIFASMAGARVADVEAVARAVLPKFYCSDIHPESWRVFSACGRRCVLTANPRMMVEAFLKEYLGADIVVGTELVVWRGRATGLVRSPGVLVGENKAAALREAFGDASPEIGIGDRRTDYPFMRLCKEGYVVPVSPTPRPVPRRSPEAGGVPRRPPGPEAVAGARAAHRALDPHRLRARLPPHRRRRAPPDARGVPRLPRPRRARHRQGHPAATGQPRDRPVRRALHLLPPHPPRPHLPLHRPRPPHHRRHLLGSTHDHTTTNSGEQLAHQLTRRCMEFILTFEFFFFYIKNKLFYSLF